MNGYPWGEPQNMGWQQSPYPPQVPYWETPQWKEKKSIRHISNVMGWSTFAVLALMVGFSVLFVNLLRFIGYPFNINYMSSGGMSAAMYYLLNCVVYIFSVAIPFMLCVAFMRLSVNEVFRFDKVGAGTAILFVLFGVGFCMFTNIPSNIIAILIEESGLNGTMPEPVSADTPLAIILSVVQVSIIPALVEELAFRGVILSQLRKFGDGFAVFGSALLFAFYHGNVLQLTFTFFVGLVLGFIMIRTNNLWVPIVIHALNNGISVFFSLIQSYVSEDTFRFINGNIFFGLILIGFIAFLLLYIFKREYFRRSYGSQYSSIFTRIMAFVTNPGFVAFFALFVFSSWANLVAV